MIKPIATHYDDCQFRSRLEARWAVFFNHMGIKYEYEREGFDFGDSVYYLPDFYFPKIDVWGEVKPENIDKKEHYKIEHILNRFVVELTSKNDYSINDQLPQLLTDATTNRTFQEGIILLDGLPNVERRYDVHVHDLTDSTGGTSTWFTNLYTIEKIIGTAVTGPFTVDNAVREARSARFEFKDYNKCGNKANVKIVESLFNV